jgi:trehalose 6-phosphate phosphatase
LLLDFDGTLVELAETPDAIEVAGQLPDLLRRLAERLEGRLAIVSGRSLGDLDRHLERVACFAVGSHGLEVRLADGTAVPAPASSLPSLLRSEAASFAQVRPGLLVEEKPGGLALHYRRAEQHGSATEAWAETAATRHGLRVQRGKMVVELLPRGVDKGEAVHRLMREPAFAGARPLFVGDDLTDEDGFEAAARHGGAGVLVGTPRTTAARWRLPDVASVHAWLEAAADG